MTATATALTPAQRISKARIGLLLNYPFWGYLVMHLEPVDQPGLAFGTMATDGSKLYYDGIGEMATWTDDQLIAAVAHETGHNAFGHLWRRENRDPMLWNVATDYAINGLLAKEQFSLHPNWLHDTKYYDMPAESIYNDLLKEANKTSGKGNKTSGKTLDDPTMWEQATSKGADNEGDSQKPSESSGEELGGGDQDEQYWKEKVVQAAQAAKMSGKLPGHLEELIENLISPTLPWQILLEDRVQRSVKTDYRIMPPNKRYLWMPIYLPSLKGEEIEIAWCLDTSGSISTEEARIGLSELKGILDVFPRYVVHYFQVDSMVQDYRMLTPDNPEDWTCEVKGRGGTSFIPVFEKIEEMDLKPSILIYFTDLEGPFPDTAPDYPVLWLTTTDAKEVPFGEKIVYTGA